MVVRGGEFAEFTTPAKKKVATHHYFGKASKRNLLQEYRALRGRRTSAPDGVLPTVEEFGHSSSHLHLRVPASLGDREKRRRHMEETRVHREEERRLDRMFSSVRRGKFDLRGVGSDTESEYDSSSSGSETDPEEVTAWAPDDPLTGRTRDTAASRRTPRDANAELTAEVRAREFPSLQSARRAYLRACRDRSVAPEPLILRNATKPIIDLHHFGMGDVVGQCLAVGLRDMPYVEHVNLTDNRLSDETMSMLVAALCFVAGSYDTGRPVANYALLTLNLSENTAGSSTAMVLSKMLRHRSCGLLELNLAHCMINDATAGLLTSTIRHNKTLTKLILEQNKIGPAGMEALAMSLSGNKTLLHLRVAWNSANLQGAAALADILAANDCALKELDVAWNGLGDAGGQEIGACLLTNSTLVELDMSNNAIKGPGAVVIATGLNINKSVKHVRLQGNPIGRAGARAFMMAMGDDEKDINMTECVLDARAEDAGMFNSNEPNGRHVLNLSSPYERTVVAEILQLATENPRCELKDITYTDPYGFIVPLTTDQEHEILPRPVSLWRHLRRNLSDLLDFLYNSGEVKGKRRGGGFNWSLLGPSADGSDGNKEMLFNRGGDDAAAADIGGGLVEGADGEDEDDDDVVRGELAKSAYGLGRLASNKGKVLRTWLAVHPRKKIIRGHVSQEATNAKKGTGDGGKEEGTVEIDTAPDMMTMETMMYTYPPGAAFKVPRKGIVTLVVESETKMPSKYDAVMSIEGVLDMINSKRLSLKDRQAMVRLATSEMFFTVEQAQALLRTDVVKRGSSVDRVKHVKQLLFRLIDSTQAAGFMKSNLTKREMQRVRRQLGQAYRMLLANPTGHYHLDLSNFQDRNVAQRLANICGDERDEALQRYGKSFDTSQHQNGFSFRNELLNNEPFVITPSFVSEMPKQGTLEFDFASTTRPSKRAVAMDDSTFHHLVMSTRLEELIEMMQMEIDSMPPEKQWQAVEFPDIVGTQDTRYSDGKGDDGEGSVDWDGESEDGGDGDEDEVKIVSRADVVDKWSKLPDERPIYLSALARTPNPNPAPPLSGKPLTADSIAATKGRIGSDEYDEMIKKHHPEIFQSQPLKVHTPLCEQSQELAKEVVTNILTFMAAGGMYIKSFQLEKLLRMVPMGVPGFRVDLFVALFSRITDLKRIDRALWAMSYPEKMEVVKRLGWLNLWNPMTPDGFVELHLDVPEQRCIAQHLVKLAIVEPGENWEDESFDGIAGWELPVSWVTEVPRKGHLTTTYTSTADGCCEDLPCRKEMRQMVLTWA